MCEFKKMKFKVKGTNQSEILQKILFNQGYSWFFGGKTLQYVTCPYLYASKDGELQCGNDHEVFLTSSEEEKDTQKYIDDFYKETQMNKLITMDKQYTYRDGTPARILCVDAIRYNGSLSVLSLNQAGEVWRHQPDGRFYHTGESKYDLIEVSPYAHIKIDDKVIVWVGNNSTTYKRHFAGVSEGGRPMTWDDGCTSFTTICKSCWDHCEKVEG